MRDPLLECGGTLVDSARAKPSRKGLARSSRPLGESPSGPKVLIFVQHLSTGLAKPLPIKVNLGIFHDMERSRADRAVARIDAALARIEAASDKLRASSAPAPANVLGLVNQHEKLREEVAATIRDVDQLIADLEQ